MLKVEKSFEEITTERFLATMFKYGFEKIDPALYILTLEAVQKTKISSNKFTYSQEKPLTKKFKEYVEYNGFCYKIKKGKNIEEYCKNHYSEDLLKAFEEVDFEKIVEKKMSMYDVDGANMDSIPKDGFHFSKKELQIRKAQVQRISDYFKKVEAEEEAAKLDRERMEMNDDYITWLVDFMSGRDNFDPEVIYYKGYEYSEFEKSQIKKLSLLIEVIDECFEEEESYDKSVKVSHLDTVLLLQEFHGQGTECYIKKITKEEEKKDAISYDEVLNYYKKKRTIASAIAKLYTEENDKKIIEAETKKYKNTLKIPRVKQETEMVNE